MRDGMLLLSLAGMLVLGAAPLRAQQSADADAAIPANPKPLPPMPPPLANANSHYTSFAVDVDVDRPIDQVWSHVGRFCALGHWVMRQCKIVSGTDVDVGSVRLVADRALEVNVARTQYSYTYAAPVRVGETYLFAHGSMRATALGPKRTRVTYGMVFDDSALPAGRTAAAEVADRTRRITVALHNMKTLEEGGTAVQPIP